MDRRGFFKGLLGLIAAAVAGSAKKVLGKDAVSRSAEWEKPEITDRTTNTLPGNFTYYYPQNIYTHNDRIFFYKNGTGTLDFWDDPKEDRYAWTDGEPVK